MPTVRSALECAGLPCRLLAFVVQVIPEEWRFNILAKLASRFVSSKRDQADTVALRTLPFAVIPRPRNHEIRALRIILFRMLKNLPRSPGIFLIPESGDVQVRDG